MAVFNADLTPYEAQNNYAPLPPGEYPVEIVDSELKRSKAGNLMARFTFSVFGTSYAGRKLWDQFVIGNEVAMRRLKSLATACGHRNPNFIGDTEELHGLRCVVRVKTEEQEGYEPRNVITNFKTNGEKEKQQPQTKTPAPEVIADQQHQQKKPQYPWQKA